MFFPNGLTKIIGYKNGRSEHYSENGKLELVMKNGKMWEGSVFKRDNFTGDVRKEEVFVLGKKIKEIEYYKNGSKSKESYYQNQKLNGFLSTWDINGNKIRRINYLDGYKNGYFIEWYSNGQKKKEGNYKLDREDGKWTSWYENGQKKKEGNFVILGKHGSWIEWTEEGKKKSKTKWKNGKKKKW